VSAEAPFVELLARTNFSFLRGGSSPRRLVECAAACGYDAIGIADCDGLYGIVRAMEAAVEVGMRLVVGAEMAIDEAPIDTLWLHVATHAGYVNLCRLLTESHARHPKGEPRKPEEGVPRNQFAGIPLDRICACADGLWCTVAVPSAPVSGLGDAVTALRVAFGERLSIALWQHRDGNDEARRDVAMAQSCEHSVPICATNRVLFARREDKAVFDVLHCIREGTTLDEAGRALVPNGEAHLKPPAEIDAIFAAHPEWLARSCEIAGACVFAMKELNYRFPSELDERARAAGETPDTVLRRLTYEGARTRYPRGLPESVGLQIEKELALIAVMKVAPYFLSVREIVEMARKRDILCQGRGSAANSAVCYCLGITAVDPKRSSLLFERFLSSDRGEPPDIDVDFEHERREEVIQAIYETYGRDRAAMVSEVISYRGKSALREVGKVFGLSLEQVDSLSGLVAWWDKIDAIPNERVRACGFDPEDRRVRLVLAMAHAIQGYPRHLSIHVGGFVLSAEPLLNVAPIEEATMRNRTVIPWDKDDLDTLRFFKVDVLGLGMLTAIRKALAYSQSDSRVAAETAIDQLARIPSEDRSVYDAICAADTVGVFQIESRAQMAMLPRLRPQKFYDLVVEVAIVRPGPIQGGMVHPYLRRRTGEEAPTIPHESLTPILDRTLGVPLFQEQVMQMAIVGAGYSGGEADQLRRDMAAWRRNGKLERHREKLLEGFTKNGIELDYAERLYQSIKGFGEYGFPESHAASFALLVYASAWLKVHHPAAFAAALINSQPMGFYSPATIVKDAERHDVEILPVRVDASDWDCTLEGEVPPMVPMAQPPALRLGLRLVAGLGEKPGRRIERARKESLFASVEDLVARAGIEKRELEQLAEAGALAVFGLGRREAIWKARAPANRDLWAAVEFGDAVPEFDPMSRAEQLLLDYRTTGVAVGDHAMGVVRPSLPAHFVRSEDLAKLAHGSRVSTAGMVICRQRPGTASGVVFITMEDEAGFINLILWASAFDRWRQVATSSSLLAVHGKIEREGQVVYVIPDRLEPLSLYDVPAMSRDFH
jgi:error-prone DNA polymerase